MTNIQRQRKTFTQSLAEQVEIAGLLGALALILVGLGIFGWQCLSWLKAGSWTPMPLSRVLAPSSYYVETSWAGLNKIIIAILKQADNLPLPLACILVASIVAVAGEILTKAIYDPFARRQRL